jgi:hypothetical protein
MVIELRYRTERLKDSQVRRNVYLELRNRFQPLMDEAGADKEEEEEEEGRNEKGNKINKI